VLKAIRKAIFFRVAFLEDELERVRMERDAYRDALLHANGLPKITPTIPQPLPLTKGRVLPSQFKRNMEAYSAKEPHGKEN